MAESKLKIDVRRAAILEELLREGSVQTENLVKQFNATPVTIRTDLAALEREGHLIRTRGGAIHISPRTSSSVLDDSILNAGEKRRIASAVASLVKNGASILMNAGTTTQLIAEALTGHQNLNIVTNSLPVAMKLGAVPTFHVIMLGGRINAQYGFTFGTDVKEQLTRYHADISIMSIDGVSAECGVSTHLAEEAIIDRMMLEHSTQHIIAADHSKVGRVGFTNIQRNIASFTLVTDSSVEKSTCERLEGCGVEIIVC